MAWLWLVVTEVFCAQCANSLAGPAFTEFFEAALAFGAGMFALSAALVALMVFHDIKDVFHCHETFSHAAVAAHYSPSSAIETGLFDLFFARAGRADFYPVAPIIAELTGFDFLKRSYQLFLQFFCICIVFPPCTVDFNVFVEEVLAIVELSDPKKSLSE